MEAGKGPSVIAWHGGQPIAFVGLWEGFGWPGGEITRMFTIAATNATAIVSAPHHRMPVILEPADWPVGLGEAEGDFPAAATLARPGRSGSGRGRRTATRFGITDRN
jgi:putative SOS response-associated peptidase YedK